MINEVAMWKWVEFGSSFFPQLPLAALFFSTSNKQKGHGKFNDLCAFLQQDIQPSTHLHSKLISALTTTVL